MGSSRLLRRRCRAAECRYNRGMAPIDPADDADLRAAVSVRRRGRIAGRPVKPDARRRSCRVTLRLTRSERGALLRLAKQAGMPVSHYVLARAIGYLFRP